MQSCLGPQCLFIILNERKLRGKKLHKSPRFLMHVQCHEAPSRVTVTARRGKVATITPAFGDACCPLFLNQYGPSFINKRLLSYEVMSSSDQERWKAPWPSLIAMKSLSFNISMLL